MTVVQSALMVFVLVMGGFAYAKSDGKFNWQEIRAVCKNNYQSDACREMREKARVYCAEHADEKRCRKMQALKNCRDHPDSEQCRKHKEKFKAYCKQNPGAKQCLRARIHGICKNNPESEECLAAKEDAHAKFCEKNPDSERCK